jgi:DNA polymerase elongation subunit (family B)
MSDSWYTNVDVRGNKVFLRYVEGDQHKMEVVEFGPELYIRTNDASKADAMSMHDEPLEAVQFQDHREMRKFIESYKDVDGFSVYGTESIMNQFVSRAYAGEIKYDGQKIRGAILDIETFSGDIEVDEYGTVNPVDGPFPDPYEASHPINLITVYSTVEKKFYSWGLEYFKDQFIGTYVHNPEHDRVGKLNVTYKGFKDEYAMLNDFVAWWQVQGFNYWSGWHIEGFDNPYLTNRIEKVCGEAAKKKLSVWNMISKHTFTNDFGEEMTVFEWFGTQMLDYKQLFEKHGFMNPEDKKLDTVARLILGEGKVDYKAEGNLNTLYIRNYQKSVEYNIVDVDLIVRMNNKKRFFELTFILAYLCKANYVDTLGTVKPWSALTYSMLCEKGQRPKIKSVYEGDVQFGGGFVREMKGGRFRWVVSCDLNSLYPHLIQQYNLGAETIIEPEDLPAEVRALPAFTMDDLVNQRVDLSVLKKYNICMTANRAFFKRGKKSIFNEKTREIYDTRKKVKKQMLVFEQQEVDLQAKIGDREPTAEEQATLDDLAIKISTYDVHQHSLKILMNSLFGAIGNKWFKECFDVRVAEGITLSGKLSILWIARKLDEYLNKILGTGETKHKIHHVSKPASTKLEVLGGKNYAIYQDTDSCYLDMSGLVDKMFTAEQQKEDPEKIVNFLDKLFNDKIEPFINKCYEELADYVNADDQRMFMKREVIATDAIWAAKKRYTMLVADSEGVRYWPKMYHKTVGLDAVKTEAPKLCREWMLDCYKIALSGTEQELQDYCAERKKEYFALPIEKMAKVSGVNGIEKYSDPNTMYIKGTPKHVKAAIWHNHLVDKLGIKGLSKVQSGDKIMYVDLKMPNPYMCETIAFQGKIPPDFKLDKYVNYEANYEKLFIGYLNNLINVVNWSAVRRASVMDWFA